MRERWVAFLRHEIRSHGPLTGAFKLRPPTREDLVEWANESWGSLPKTTIIRGFVKCNLIDDTEDAPASPGTDDAAQQTSNESLDSLLQQLRMNDVSVEELGDTSNAVDIPDGHDD